MIDMLQTWIENIRSNDANKVADLYHKKGLLLGTFSNIERSGQRILILDYFNNLLKSQVDVEIITKHEYKSESIATASGLYNFILNDQKIEARFSFVFLKTKKNGKSYHITLLSYLKKLNLLKNLKQCYFFIKKVITTNKTFICFSIKSLNLSNSFYLGF